MKKLIVCISLVCAGLMVSCVDKNEEVDEDSKPEWLGNSIYAELQNADQNLVTGTFKYYLRLVDDLGYSDVLGKTGSKTVFPANDEAFERFFSSNLWGVTSYENLTYAQKKMLLYSSMLDNSILVSMLSNVSTSSAVEKGKALKHSTTLSVIDSIPFYLLPTTVYKNTSYWAPFDDKGIYVISDNTQPMMVHFTREQMLANDITTAGNESDFAIITGTPYTEGSAYIFRDQIIKSDITCQNGYIHQVKDVIVPPGNMAQVIRESGETSLFSRMLDRFAIPYFDQTTTNNYNDWAKLHSAQSHDSIYQVRYLSSVSQDQKALNYDTHNNTVSSDYLLPFDPGWNQYYVQNKLQTSVDWTLADIGAMFVPNDDALEKYFVPGGNGEFLIDQYGVKSNTKSNLNDNVDAIPQNIIQKFVSNLMKASFIASVPSKFSSITNDVSNRMGMTTDYLNKNSDGTYDVRIANNGVIYVMKSVVAPTEYEAVSAPALFRDNMKVINWIIQNKSMNGTTATKYAINLDFYAYLKAMTANYAVFLPDDEAFGNFYVEPASLGSNNPIAYHFYYNSNVDSKLCCSKWSYDITSNTVKDSLSEVSLANSAQLSIVASVLSDIMNYHTVVLKSGEKLGTNNYYKTKNGGEIKITGASDGSKVVSGGQIDNGLTASKIINHYNEKNGVSYEIDHLIQGPQQSVYKVLSSNSQFSDFMALCSGFESADLLTWAGISADKDATTNVSPQDQYKVFVSKNGLDYNVRFFNTYNYTVYAPDNEAMMKANLNGLPTWVDIQNLYETYDGRNNDEEAVAKLKAYAMINVIKSFIRYHFQSTSVYADNVVDTASYQSLCSNDMGLFEELTVTGGNGVLTVKDNRKQLHNIYASSSDKLVNVMTRDFEFDAAKTSATKVVTSSFGVIHEIRTPLYYNSTTSYDTWSSAKGLSVWRKIYSIRKANNKL